MEMKAVSTMKQKTYRLAGWDDKPEKTVVRVGDVEIGGDELTIIAGPCAVESLEQVMTIAAGVSELGIKLFRGGAYKPRTSPYSFQGLGLEGLKMLAEVREVFGLGIVTEAISVESIDLIEKYADVIQIGARNMHNFDLLRRAGQARKPVLLKRGMCATLEEFIFAAEYILLEGNKDVVLCERGLRTFNDHTRNTLDLAVVPAVRDICHLPIIVDPSHAAGTVRKVIPLACASVAAGTDGIIVEVHHQPEKALSDGPQALSFKMLGQMIEQVTQIAAIVRQDSVTLAT